MGDEYIVVNSSQNISYFDEKTLFEYLNDAERYARSGIGFTFLEKFPLSNSNTFVGGSKDLGKDSKGRPFGRFCPFGDTKSWPQNALLILKNGTIFVPKKVSITKVVEEYGLPNTDATPAPTIKAKAATKTAAKRTRK